MSWLRGLNGPSGDTGASATRSNQREVSGSLGHDMSAEGLPKPILQCPLERELWESGLCIQPRYLDFLKWRINSLGAFTPKWQITEYLAGTQGWLQRPVSCPWHRALHLEGPKLGLTLHCCPLEIPPRVGTRGPAFSFCSGHWSCSWSFRCQLQDWTLSPGRAEAVRGRNRELDPRAASWESSNPAGCAQTARHEGRTGLMQLCRRRATWTRWLSLACSHSWS